MPIKLEQYFVYFICGSCFKIGLEYNNGVEYRIEDSFVLIIIKSIIGSILSAHDVFFAI